jgi:hypothetical protein
VCAIDCAITIHEAKQQRRVNLHTRHSSRPFSPLLRNEMKIAVGFLMRHKRPLRVRDDDDDLSLKMPFFYILPFFETNRKGKR